MAAGGRGRLPAAAAAAARDAPPGPAGVPAGAMAAAEAAAAEVVRRVRPTEASERRRAEVVDYARRLFGATLGCEVFAYGSVPLKTYLPDGDIDLTILGNASPGSTLVNDIYCILDSEEQSSDAEFEVKDLDRINAEVRLIKCTIGNIIVDISFNQTGGICALCFLELVDRKVGKNHLFKRSIILIKAWCYYESRLLGAHHGLISTYALEILILYIFNLFHKFLHGPLEVLHTFLQYFSKFDWDNYCISLNGPVALSSLPNLIVEATEAQTDDLLFDKEFLKSSLDEVFEPPKGSGACYTRFRPKHLNIIDPLKEYNNLGRSVNRASFHRIRTAFSYGARKLGQILMSPSELIANETYGFFKNTLGRNRRGFRPDVASSGAFHPSSGTDKDVLEEIPSMSISYRNGDGNRIPRDISKGLGYNSSHIRTNGPTCLSSCLPEGHNIASRTDLRSSHAVHHGTKQYSMFYLENGNGGSAKCEINCNLGHETEQLSYCTTTDFNLDDKPSIQSQFHVNSSLLTLNSYADANNLVTDMKRWSTVHVEKQHLPSLSGDLDLQFRCLRQVQYHLEYLFDALLQSVQEAASNDKFPMGSFYTPTLNILLNTDIALPELLLLSSAKGNGVKRSPVSCSDSIEDISKHSQDEDPWDVACQQDISLPSGTDIQSNGLSPCSSYGDSDSSVSWYYSSEDSPEMHGTETCFSRKSYDTSKEELSSSRENGKILTNRPVQTESSQSSAPGRSFIPHEEQIAFPGRTKGQPVRAQGYIHLDRKVVEMHGWDPQKEFVRHDNKTRQIPKSHRDICLNMNILQNQQHGTDMEFARTPSAMRQMTKSTSTYFTSTSLIRNLPTKQTYGARKEHGILDWPTRHRPSCEPSQLQNQRHGRVCSQKYSAGKQSCNNYKEHQSFVTGTGHIAGNGAVSTLSVSGTKREFNSNKFDVNGNQLWPLLQEVPPVHSINNQEKAPVSVTSLPSFPITKSQPLETIEFGSLGPFALAFSSSKSKEVTNAHPGCKVLTDSSALVQRSRAGARHSRSPEFCKLGNEVEFPPLNAGVR